MATYTNTSYTFNIELPEVDTTMTTSIALTCTTGQLRQVNEYLTRAKQVVSKRGHLATTLMQIQMGGTT